MLNIPGSTDAPLDSVLLTVARKISYRTVARDVMTLMVAAALIISPIAYACTSFVLRTSDNSAVYGRTMEFAFPLKSGVLVIPRQYAVTAAAPAGKKGMQWKTKYAAVGMNALGVTALADGVNEKGLAGGILYFANYVGYADSARFDSAKSLAPWDFLTWALTNFASVAEVKAALQRHDISIIGLREPHLGFVPPFHYTLHDATGASLVVEPVNGALKVYDNPLGVMTNSPTFDWHLTNLKNYVKISPTNAPPLKLEGQTFAPLGQGSGLLGIPGDPTPPSRFIRALGYTLSVEKKPSGTESVRLAEHILNNFDIPPGWIRERKGEAPANTPLEYTQWSTVADLKNKTYYVKTAEDQVLRSVDLMKFNLNAKTLAIAELQPNMVPPALFPNMALQRR